jgi:hypothetical protein
MISTGFVTVLALVLAMPAQTVDTNLLSKKIEPATALPGQEFFQVCRYAGIPCGFESRRDEATEQQENTRLKKGTVREILDSIVQNTWKGYAWRLSDGVIEVMPKAVLAGAPSVLNKRLPEVNIERMFIKEAATKICGEARVAVLGGGDIGGAYRKKTGEVSLHAKNITVRDALNALVRQDGQSIWMVYPCEQGHCIRVDLF